MSELYNNILSLCRERYITGGKMCMDLGLSKSLMTDLKAGRKKTITLDTAQKIADYFGVSVDRVMGVKKEAPPQTVEEQLNAMSDTELLRLMQALSAELASRHESKKNGQITTEASQKYRVIIVRIATCFSSPHFVSS